MLLACLLYFVGFAMRLWMIHDPPYIVFDEVHFGQFLNNYYKGKFFLDIHPPFAKLVMYGISKVAGYDGSICFESECYSDSDDFYVFLRMTNAIISSMCFPLLFSLLVHSSGSTVPALFASLIAMSETSLYAQHRFILIDGILHTAVCLHLLVVSTCQSNCLAGLTLGMAISCKLTAMGLVPFTIIVMLTRRRFVGTFTVMTVASCVMFILFFIDILLLRDPCQYAKDLLPHDLYDSLFVDRTVVGMAAATVKVPIIMHHLNMKNTRFHPYQSDPSSWPLLTGIWVHIWSSETREINCLGNPVVFLGVFISVCACLIYMNANQVASLSCIGWVVSYIPFLFVSRSMFLYHYQIPLIFGFVAIGCILERLPYHVGLIAFLAAFSGFVYLSPFVYGMRISNRDSRVLFQCWSTGGSRHQALVEEFFDFRLG